MLRLRMILPTSGTKQLSNAHGLGKRNRPSDSATVFLVQVLGPLRALRDIGAPKALTLNPYTLHPTPYTLPQNPKPHTSNPIPPHVRVHINIGTQTGDPSNLYFSCLGFRVRVSGLRFRIYGVGSRVWGLGWYSAHLLRLI